MRQKEHHPLRAYALMTAILSYLAGSVLVGVFAGRWLDRQLHTEPVFLIIGLLIGLAAGIVAMLRLVQHFFQENER
ncbi:hypothetical protein CX649_01995 [Bacillaceae bacterium ZC4]|uniref:AtpZ/AtpI family protein n=1 Tax=Aeribacillus TaxID=1055323 RepID=UPI0007B46A8A|nr:MULTISPECIES: AtpZ/AtpI family protein [Aeribacillus]AXI38524.1 hypothetical protein CX649_01995 [Bacillaceae bacterium ZC4]KZM53298.1 hypothetical protein A3Q35_02435 [Aeribacillus pallidus]MED0649403.1 AtpZ/AtpI family protein [Aeribacillus composti]MED4487003.1 AtpZ/AtpI family protein [Aeribacillus pallidus]